MPKMAYRHNCARDADAIAHGMHNRMGAKCLGCVTALVQGKKICQQQVLDTTVLRMEMQLRMGCATVWGRASTYRMEMCNCIGARRATMPKTGCRNNRAKDADGIAHGMCNCTGAGPAPATWGGAPVSGQG